MKSLPHFRPSDEGAIMTLAYDHYEKEVADYLHFYNFTRHVPCSVCGIKELQTVLKNKGVHIAMVTGKGNSAQPFRYINLALPIILNSLNRGTSCPRNAEGIRVFSHAPGYLATRNLSLNCPDV